MCSKVRFSARMITERKKRNNIKHKCAIEETVHSGLEKPDGYYKLKVIGLQ